MAQTYDRAIDVSGTVLDKETNQPMADVRVTVKNSDGTSTTAMTDADGNYTMKTFSQYSALITFEKNGYIIGTQSQDISGENVSGIVLDIALKPNTANTTLMTGNVVDPETNQPVAGAKVTFKGDDGSISETYTDNLGRYNMNVNVGMKAKLTVEKDGYEFSSTEISTNGKAGRNELKLNVNLKKADPSKQAVAMSNTTSKKTDYEHVVDLTALNIDNVLFDYDKAYIREDAKPTLDQIRELMVQFPGAVLIISTHSDSRGSTAYNQQLSMSRGMSIKGYLLKQGISLNRMRIEYFGETRPLNGCVDDVPCNEEEYEVNRRAEFMLVTPVNQLPK
jgi:outer membrane protein OmpA-like peptidoglycan-associated protein